MTNAKIDEFFNALKIVGFYLTRTEVMVALEEFQYEIENHTNDYDGIDPEDAVDLMGHFNRLKDEVIAEYDHDLAEAEQLLASTFN